MNIEMLDIYECVSDSIKYTSNKGYREEQIQSRKACERNVLASLKAMFPDNTEYFDIKNFKNNAGDADFGVTYHIICKILNFNYRDIRIGIYN